ncbi:thioesterase family protein [uncultured Psychrobacter sp.]|uniref:acyl-CoA thioesterase n=1 Tax=uncultured Psychrobacter sp. TaxID=259303 RepID=UPI00261FAC7B|nr:thioesterase family protein [uncultured Psychrobacter sp.]
MIDRELEFDDRVFVFETVMRVRNTEIDVGQLLTLESLIALLAEARARFLYSKGIKEINAEYQGLIVSNLQLNIISRVRAREELLFEVGIEHISDKDGEMAIKVTRMYDGSLVAKARKSFVQYDYRSNRSISFNNDVKEALNQSPFEL